MSVSDICKDALAQWMIDNHHTLKESSRHDFGYDRGIYVNWYISGKKPTAWKRRACGSFNGQKYRVFTRSGAADQTDTPVQEVKDSPAKFWVVWLTLEGTVDRIEWMTIDQLTYMGAKDNFKGGVYGSLDWYW